MLAVSVKNLSKTYKSGVHALNDVSFDVFEGDFFALLGPNGAGKSTLIGILSSLVNMTHGQVSILGHDIQTDFARAKLAMGLVPQEFNFNIFDRVEKILEHQAGYYGIPPKTAAPRIKHYLTKLGLWEKRKFPAKTLSGGMKRRLMIARALIHDPKILILDEPTAGLDIELRRMMWSFLIELNQSGTTIILTTHYLEEAEHLCRNIAIIDRGRLIENTSMSNMLRKLDTEKFILYLSQPITTLPNLLDYKIWKIDDNTLEVEVSNQLGLSNLFQELTRHQINVVSMRNKVSRLEELFVRLISVKE